MTTIYLTNFASRRPPQRGPGRVWSIMAKPRHWEHGDGRVAVLTPHHEDLDALRAGAIDFAEYRHRFGAGVPRGVLALRPGGLLAQRRDDRLDLVAVADGDTLCCACSREAADLGECHRVFAAPLLVAAGWRVILDGVERVL